ncbi:tRNA A37 threonylcarbamoyladenosine synthetase subunit TsaC/SUA5/YrdC [Elusimicrobium posterum]|uniref:L-threonylcarbamoyladenylate synthase n=1 Tax=Elusimicrobium posterum TaxID=3116653 RepID=UPI003C70E47F
MPAHDFTVKILNAFGGVLTASSANIHGQGVIKEAQEIIETFNGKVDYIFTGGDFKGTASSVVQTQPFKIIREGAITEYQILSALK